MAAGCGWPRPVVDQAIGLAVQERDLEVAGAGKMFSKQVSSSTAELLEMEADLAKRDVRTDHSLHGRRATGYPHQTGKLMLPHPGRLAARDHAGTSARASPRPKLRENTRSSSGEIKRLSADLGPAAIAKQLGVARSTVYRLLGKALPLG